MTLPSKSIWFLQVHMVYGVTTMIVSKHGLTSLNYFTCFSQVAIQWREQLVPAGPYGPRGHYHGCFKAWVDNFICFSQVAIQWSMLQGCKASVLTFWSDPTHRAFAKGQFRQRRSNSKWLSIVQAQSIAVLS